MASTAYSANLLLLIDSSIDKIEPIDSGQHELWGSFSIAQPGGTILAYALVSAPRQPASFDRV